MKTENALACDFLNELLDSFDQHGWKQEFGYGKDNEACMILRMAPIRYRWAPEVVNIAMLEDPVIPKISGGTDTERVIAFNDASTTAWKDVKALIERAKKRLES